MVYGESRLTDNKKKFFIAWAMVFVIVLLCGSCSSMHAGMYLVSVDRDDVDGKTILRNEPQVKAILENIIDSYENYTVKAFSRTGINFQIRQTKLLTHSFYVIIFNDNGEYHTLSFYGTQIAFRSEGAWAYDAVADISSYRMYLEGDNKWDVRELFPDDTINTRETVRNIIKKIDSDTTYYYKDHIVNKPRMDNCNTALYETIVREKRE